MIGANNIDIFIQRYKRLMSNQNYSATSRILRLKFEDLVLNYSECSLKINNFIGIEDANSKKAGVLFDPEKSKNNIGIWRKYSHLPEIRKIENELSDYCFQ